MRKVDLHIHTKYSDGEYDEYEIVEKIKQFNIDEFAICDHDTIEGVKRVSEVVKNEPSLVFHTGVEFSSRANNFMDGINMHLLVRDFDINDEGINYLINKGASLRREKVQLMVDFVKEVYGIVISDEKIRKLEESTNAIGKPHIYKLLCEYGDYDREEYYTHMNTLKSEHLKVEAEEVLKHTKGNAYVTLAHPIEIMDEYNLGSKDIDKIVGYLVGFGLKGLETRHSKQTESDYREFSKIAQKYGLIETCGSDYHGPSVKPNVILGKCVKE